MSKADRRRIWEKSCKIYEETHIDVEEVELPPLHAYQSPTLDLLAFRNEQSASSSSDIRSRKVQMDRKMTQPPRAHQRNVISASSAYSYTSFSGVEKITRPRLHMKSTIAEDCSNARQYKKALLACVAGQSKPGLSKAFIQSKGVKFTLIGTPHKQPVKSKVPKQVKNRGPEGPHRLEPGVQ